MRLHAIALLFVLFAALLFSNPAATTHAGEIIDYLPEIQTARSFGWAFGAAILNSGRFGSCDQDSAQREIPDHILYDDNGVVHSATDIADILVSISCLYRPTFEIPFPSREIFAQLLLDVIRGNDVTIYNGNIVDGRKQSVRVETIIRMHDRFLTEVFVADSRVWTSTQAEACQFVIDATSLENTIELQFAAYFALSSIMDSAQRLRLGSICHEVRSESDEELLAAAQNGDLEAGINLARRNISSITEQLEEEDPSAFFEDLAVQLNTIGLQVLENTAVHPIASMSLASGAYSLYLFEYINRFLQEASMNSES